MGQTIGDKLRAGGGSARWCGNKTELQTTDFVLLSLHKLSTHNDLQLELPSIILLPAHIFMQLFITVMQYRYFWH